MNQNILYVHIPTKKVSLLHGTVFFKGGCSSCVVFQFLRENFQEELTCSLTPLQTSMHEFESNMSLGGDPGRVPSLVSAPQSFQTMLPGLFSKPPQASAPPGLAQPLRTMFLEPALSLSLVTSPHQQQHQQQQQSSPVRAVSSNPSTGAGSRLDGGAAVYFPSGSGAGSHGFNDRVLTHSGGSGSNRAYWITQPKLTPTLALIVGNAITIPPDQLTELAQSMEHDELLSNNPEALRSFNRLTIIRLLVQGDAVILEMEDENWTPAVNHFVAPGLSVLNRARIFLFNTGLRSANGQDDMIALAVRTKPGNGRHIQIMRFFPSSDLATLGQSMVSGAVGTFSYTNAYFWSHCLRDLRNSPDAVQPFANSAFGFIGGGKMEDRRTDFRFHLYAPTQPELLQWNPRLPLERTDDRLRQTFVNISGGQQLDLNALLAAIEQSRAQQHGADLTLLQYYASTTDAPRVQLLVPIAYRPKATPRLSASEPATHSSSGDMSYDEWRRSINYYLAMSYASGSYVLNTILPADIALQNSRVVARPSPYMLTTQLGPRQSKAQLQAQAQAGASRTKTSMTRYHPSSPPFDAYDARFSGKPGPLMSLEPPATAAWMRSEMAAGGRCHRNGGSPREKFSGAPYGPAIAIQLPVSVYGGVLSQRQHH